MKWSTIEAMNVRFDAFFCIEPDDRTRSILRRSCSRDSQFE